MSAIKPTVAEQVQQAAAVPYRHRDGATEFCFVTSSSGRWIFPKGVIAAEIDPVKTAAKEAFEEAGLLGQVVGGPLGYYPINKNGESLTVVAFLMHVAKSAPTWKEDSWRKRRWIVPEKADRLISDAVLRELLQLALGRIDQTETQLR